MLSRSRKESILNADIGPSDKRSKASFQKVASVCTYDNGAELRHWMLLLDLVGIFVESLMALSLLLRYKNRFDEWPVVNLQLPALYSRLHGPTFPFLVFSS